MSIKSLEGDFYSFRVGSLLKLRFAMVLSRLDNNKTIRAPDWAKYLKMDNFCGNNDIESLGI